MEPSSSQNPSEAHLLREIARLRRPLSPTEDPAHAALVPHADAPPAPAPTALDLLATAFELSPEERSLLVLCAGVSLDPELARACGGAPTLAGARALLPALGWRALSPAAPLRAWRLVHLAPDVPSLAQAPLCIDEFVLSFLLGDHALDPRLCAHISPAEALPLAELLPSHDRLAEELAAAWVALELTGPAPATFLDGPPAAVRAVAAAAGSLRGCDTFALQAPLIPEVAEARRDLLLVWERYARLTGAALLLEDVPPPRAEGRQGAQAWIDACRAPLFVGSRDKLPLPSLRSSLRFSIPPSNVAEQRALWDGALAGRLDLPDAAVDALAAQFELAPEEVDGTVALVRAEVDAARAAAPLPERLWDACRSRARTHMDGLAQHVTPDATWDDLVLPPAQSQTLRELVAHVRQRFTVHHTWAMGRAGARGLGVSALFAGPSGTGKTTAAEVLARELRMDLYRIDLSAVVSKYIGETEKNLRRVFDAAEAGGSVLLFDEADALFGKRSEVKDSHDRYANMEVSYLLQRMEAFRGLAILTTNLKGALDTAFLRRLRFVVEFPFPDAAQRAALWARMFPPAVPTDGVDPARLARLQLTGGVIRNVALHAAFLAADAGEPVRMRHVLQAARRECAKHERPLSEAEARALADDAPPPRAG